MKTLIHIILFTLISFTSIAQSADKSSIQFNSFVDDRISIYYYDTKELIGFLPLKIAKKELKSAHILIKGNHTEDAHFSLPVREITELNVKPLDLAKIADQDFVSGNKLSLVINSSIDVFVHELYDKDRKKTNIVLEALENNIPKKSLLGVGEKGKLYQMVEEGIAFDPIFGTRRNIRTNLCNSLYNNSIEVTKCEEIKVQEALINVLHKQYSSVKPVIEAYAMKVFSSRFKESYFGYGFYNLKMKYKIKLHSDSIEVVISNYGFYPSNDVNSLFFRALYDNVTILFSDSSTLDKIRASNKVYESLYSINKINVKPFVSNYPTLKETIKNSTACVATIEDEDNRFGSGFLINDSGYILSNYHVIEGSKNLKVKLGKDTTSYEGKVVRYDDYYDLAIIKIQKQKTPYLMLSKTTETEVGEPVIAIGTPAALELGQSVSKGIISGHRTFEGRTYIQTDVSINPGNSGGPLLNEQGDVIGIVVMKMVGRGLEGLGFAIPAYKAIELLNIKYE